jgi:hypothetical protein
MVDSLSNVCTALELGANCLQPTDDSRIERVVSVKPRAGFEPIVCDFAISESKIEISVPQAIRYVQEQTAVVRKALGLTDQYLFVSARRHAGCTTTGHVLNSTGLRNWLHLMMGGGYRERPLLTPSSIRVSGLMHRTLASGGEVVATELHAHHQSNSGVSEGYARTYPVKLLYTKKIRSFTDFLQNKIVFTHLQLKNAFGLTKAQADELLEHAERTGFGFSCKSPFSNSSQIDPRDERCDEVGVTCLGCAGSLFLADFENFVDVLCLRSNLLERRDELEVQATAKWESEYLPLLAYAEVVVEKAKRSMHAALFRKAQFHVNELARKGQLPEFLL